MNIYIIAIKVKIIMSTIENINELINIFNELINQNIITYPTTLMELYNCININHYNSDENFIEINYKELVNRGMFLAKNHIVTKIIMEHAIGNFSLVTMDKISINILLTHRENLIEIENNNKRQLLDDQNMQFHIKSYIRKRKHINGYNKYKFKKN